MSTTMTPHELISRMDARNKRVTHTLDQAVKLQLDQAVDTFKLSEAAPTNWRKKLEHIGIKERTASRLNKLGKWWNDIRGQVKDLLPRLPDDLHKLELLADTSAADLRAIEKVVDLREATRAEIEKAVFKALDKKKSDSTITGSVKTLKQSLKAFKTRITNLVGDIDPGELQGIRGEVDDELQEILKLFQQPPSEVEVDDDADTEVQEGDEAEEEAAAPAKPKSVTFKDAGASDDRPKGKAKGARDRVEAAE